MKGKSKYLVLLILLLVICGGLTTYALFRTNKSGNANVNAARWNVVFKNGEEEISNNFNISLNNATWTNPLGNVASGKIAPGSQATFYITIDATNTETSVDYTAEIEDSFNETDFDVTLADDSGTIPYSTESGAMIRQIPIQVVWNGTINDSNTKNNDDLLKKARDITIPIKLTAAQKIALIYTVTFNDGLGNIISTKKVNEGDTVGTLPADPTREKYVFLGWYDDIENGNEVTAETIATSGMMIYAHWEQWKGRIPVVPESTLPTSAYDGNLTTYASTRRDSWQYLKLPTLTNRSRINIVFEFNCSGDSTTSNSTFGIGYFDNQKTSIQDYHAYYKTSHDFGSNWLYKGPASYPVLTETIPIGAEYIGVQHPDSGCGINIYDMYITEVPFEDIVTVTFNSDGGSAIDSIQIEKGERISIIPKPTKENSRFEGWFDSNNNQLTTSTIINSNVTYTALWEDGLITIPYDSSNTLPAEAYDGNLTTYASTKRDSWRYVKLPNYPEGSTVNIVFSFGCSGDSTTSSSTFGIGYFDNQKTSIQNYHAYYKTSYNFGNNWLYIGPATYPVITETIPSGAEYIGLQHPNSSCGMNIYDIYLHTP